MADAVTLPIMTDPFPETAVRQASNRRVFRSSSPKGDAIHVGFVLSGVTAGGAERQLLHFLAGCNKGRIDPTVVTVLSPTSPLRRGGADLRPELRKLKVRFHSLNLERFPTIPGAIKLGWLIRTLGLDCIHSYGLAVDLTLRLLSPLLRNIPLIGSIRGPEAQRSSFTFRIDGWTSRLLAAYVSNSRAGTSAMIQRARVDAARILEIPNGLDTDAFLRHRRHDARERLRSQWQFSPDEVAVLTVANIHRAKGHEDIVLAAAELKKRKAPVRFLFAGEDRTSGRIQKRIDELGIRGTCQLLGRRDDIADLLGAADIFLLASHWEGMSNALMEAMCAGVPCVATDVGAAAELLQHGTLGLLIPPHQPDGIVQAIEKIMGSPSEWASIGAEAASNIRSQYAMSTMVTRYERLYENIAARDF